MYRVRQYQGHSGFIGVSFDKSRFGNKWKAEISYNKEKYFIGYFCTAEEASIAYINKKEILTGGYDE
jgi:hypothetical protein